MAENSGNHHIQTHHSVHTDLDHRAAYIFKPGETRNASNRPTKRRRTTASFHGHDDEQVTIPLVPLLNGLESETLVRKRYHTFRNVWDKQEQNIQDILRASDTTILQDVSSFIENISPDDYNGYIPARLFNLGSNMSSMARLLNRLRSDLHVRRIAKVVTLESGDAPNLKTVLKHIIREATTGDDADLDPPSTGAQNGMKYLPYDLDALHEHMQRQGMSKVVIAFQDSEAFDQSLLTDLLSLLSSWTDRISFILLFGIATSVELFEGRLARATANLLQGTRFDIQGCDDLTEQIFVTLQTQPENFVWLGPNVSEIILEKSKDHFESPESFAYGIKYAYMTHFFANPLSVLCSGDCNNDDFQPELCEAIRNTPSFQHYVEGLIESRQPAVARGVLENDKVLANEVLRIMNQNRLRTHRALRATINISHMISSILPSHQKKLSDLIVQAFSGDLLDSNDLEDLLSTIKKQASDELLAFLESLPPDLREHDTYISLILDLKLLINSKRGNNVLRSEYDDRNQGQSQAFSAGFTIYAAHRSTEYFSAGLLREEPCTGRTIPS
ncbi:Origin recognition complex, subunit 3 [Ascosphaera apis ARSEF 7405]|uniref:Origin recognition complex, subunit 3 n=1 Tax=Ascosphaera apis ARSEF 7405 TaxID=392613 RepID=A0A167ZVZ5_9EURO|nr:Origin recognition complex, subunit 3 [Ascosphaera apis ARSEF 7405]